MIGGKTGFKQFAAAQRLPIVAQQVHVAALELFTVLPSYFKF